MRSKQQPRPSYRWLNKTEENDGCEDIIETSQTKDESSSRSESPSSTNSLEDAPTVLEKVQNDQKQEFSHCESSPKLIDSHDDIEHNIPASFIQDPHAKCEMVSPRCPSRNSSHEERCASEESNYSQRDLISSRNTMSPVAISLTSTLSQAAALLPQHSAAMAAYLEVAAAAVQQNRLALTSPLSVTDQNPSTLDREEILDFSRKDTSDCSDSLESKSDNGAVNLSKTENSPLDLSVSNRKRNTSESLSLQPVPRKLSRLTDFKSAVAPWTSAITPQIPYFAAAVVAASLSPKNNGSTEYNVKNKSTNQNSDTNKALEKMSELSRLSGNEMYRSTNSASSSSGRHSAWQSHWLNKGADSAKDVLKCVWCKESFPSLAAMTTHMKETKHCGVNVPPISSIHSTTSQSQTQPVNTTSISCNTNTSTSKQHNQNDFNLLIKETMPLPRKLVRGQDVWLGKGAEQTRQILKCMWCGQSFRTLAEMTTHMQHTQHYTNIISQEQIISWRSSDEKGANPSSSGGLGNNSSGPSSGNPANSNAAAHISHVSAVLTCKVCDQAFSSLKELSNHMVKNAHYKEHIMRSITESGGRRRQPREKRKKSLPVRKLLELERAQQDFKNGDENSSSKTIRDLSAARITCEKCNDKIDTSLFVEHIRQCVGGNTSSSTQKIKSILMNNTIIPISSISLSNKESVKSEIISSPLSSHSTPPHSVDIPAAENTMAVKKSCSPSVLNALEMLIEKSFESRPRHLNSSFNQNQSTTALGSSILKRLGIDESVDYTKPLVDSQTMNLLRNYHQQQYGQFDKRERSGSESSSISERGSSRMDSVTPEKKFDISNTPCGTPDKFLNDGNDEVFENRGENKIKIKDELASDDDLDADEDDNTPTNLKIKKECSEEQITMKPPSRNDNPEDFGRGSRRRNSCLSSPPRSPRPKSSSVPISPALSPASDHHSTASRSTPSMAENKVLSSSGSLGALSSMFDNLTGSNNQVLTDSSSKLKKTTAHPLAALQKLCDKTENPTNHRSNSIQNATLLSPTNSISNPRIASAAVSAQFTVTGNVESGDDNSIKCSFCDNVVNTKSDYRHHLAKVHFINDESSSQQQAPQSDINLSKPNNKSQTISPQSPKSTNPLLFPNLSGNVASTSSTVLQQNKISPIPSPSSISDESPHSKFLKYTELAKQLSSKYV